MSKISRFKIEEIECWLHPSEELIEAYQKLEVGSKICDVLQNDIRNIENWLRKNHPLVVNKVLNGNGLDEILPSEIPDDKKREMSNDILNNAREEFQPLSEQYEASVSIFKDHYGIDIDIQRESR